MKLISGKRASRFLSAAAVFAGLAALGGGDLLAQTTPAPQPSICTRSCWSATSNGYSSTIGLNRAIVHHTAGTYGNVSLSHSKNIVRSIQSQHKSLGWGDIGYHFLIDALGNIFEGRLGSMASGTYRRGAHDGTNANSYGFSNLGNYQNNTFTTAGRNANWDVIAWRMPSGWSPYGSGTYNGKTVGRLDGHLSVKATACPGTNIWATIGTNYSGGTARDAVASRRGGSSGPNLSGHMELFARSGTTLYHKRRLAGEGWTSWTSLGGSVAGNPGVASWEEGRVNIYMRGTNGNIHKRRYSNGSWGPWGELAPPPGGFQGSVGVASRKYEHYIIAVRGNDNAIWKRSFLGYTGQGWNDWSRLDATAGDVASSPTVVSRAEDRISIFYRNTSNVLKRIRWDEANPSTWIGPSSHGGGLDNNPSAVSANPDHIYVYSRAWDGNLWRRGLLIGDGWTDWEPIGTGGIVSGPAATNLGGGNRHDIAFRAPDNSIKIVYRLNGTWNGPVNHGGNFLGGPGAVTWNK